MARKINMTAVFVALVAAVLRGTHAETYTVGDSAGWIIPSNNANLYEDWASNKSFAVGDVLVFNFTTGAHNVAEVTEAAYDACTTTNTVFTENTGPARIPLNSTGEHYFICAVPGHCSSGQKLKVDVETAASTPRSSPNTPTDVSTPSSASSLVATLSLVLMSLAFALLC